MAAPTAEQKAEAAKAAADQKAAEQQAEAAAAKAAQDKAEADRQAQERAEAAQAAAATEAARVAAAEEAATVLQVIGPVAVLPLVAGGERYVYRGTPVGEGFTAEGVAHAVSVGLVGIPKNPSKK
ncbi:hypothetical protein [Pseudoclavibacter sp. 8L]|uniref:hypothetical protein n=1 Tax=Pseudoclavibacter sp. 8L TaxID=2653162 RepID=UPI0012EEEE78|nr:hypothetical protein [Pseudoclavibacter sp. 8L]VXB32944.1 conserved hypothetical protein [Pseudoclavibacter sp. 8L]